MWKMSFIEIMTLWVIWKVRNNRCFDGIRSCDGSLESKVKFVWHLGPVPSNWFEVTFSSPHWPILHSFQSPLPSASLKLNFDERVIGNPGPSVIGGIIKYNSSSCILSFPGLSVHCSVNEAELIALRTGLRKLANWVLIISQQKVVLGALFTGWQVGLNCHDAQRMFIKKCLCLASKLSVSFMSCVVQMQRQTFWLRKVSARY